MKLVNLDYALRVKKNKHFTKIIYLDKYIYDMIKGKNLELFKLFKLLK